MANIIMGIRMIDLQSLIRLQTWLSPAFPIGAFSYSSGLEAAIVSDVIENPEELHQWLLDILHHGQGWNDAVLVAESWRQCHDTDALKKFSELGIAMNFSKSRHLEITMQGDAFLKAARTWCEIDTLPTEVPLPVAVGAVCGHYKIELEAVLAAFLHAYISNQIQAALRLMKLGQQGGVQMLQALDNEIIQVATSAAKSDISDLASSAFMADIASMKHETLPSRIFRS